MDFLTVHHMPDPLSTEILFSASSASWEGKAHSRLSHTCQLDIDQIPDYPRQTAVICTLGTSWASAEGIKKMSDGGMNILRLNLAITARDVCRKAIKAARALDDLCNYSKVITCAFDMTAAPLRTGYFEGGKKQEVLLKEGDKVTLTMDEQYKMNSTKDMIFVDTTYFPSMIHSIHKGDRIHVGECLIVFIVKEVGMDSITCLVEEGGPVGGYQRVVLPRERLYQASVETSYLKDLAFASECEADFVFTSYADNSEMLKMARNHLPGHTKIFAKIETRQAVKNLPDIMNHCDGVLISRADLGLEYMPERVFKLQKHIIAQCRIARKPVFVIGQLLESMHSKPRATRAEASDVANAVLDGADGLVLTVETSKGIYPYESLECMAQICREAERAMLYETERSELYRCRAERGLCRHDVSHVTALSAVEAAESCGARAIFVITTSGSSAISVSCAGPSCPVIGIVRSPDVARMFHAYRGLHPFVYTGERKENWCDDMDLRLNAAVKAARADGLVKAHDNVVIVTGSLAGTGSTNTMQVFAVPGVGKTLRVVSSKQNLTYPAADLQRLRIANGNQPEVGEQGADDMPCPL